MKKYFVTIEYLRGLGSFLDEKGIEWINNGNNTITIIFKTLEDVFLNGKEFAEWYLKLENNEL